jgi:hypothetical protein
MKFQTPLSANRDLESANIQSEEELDDSRYQLKRGDKNSSSCQYLSSLSKLSTNDYEYISRATPTALSKILKEIDYKNTSANEKPRKSICSNFCLKNEEKKSNEKQSTRDSKENFESVRRSTTDRLTHMPLDAKPSTSQNPAKKEGSADKSLANILGYTPMKQQILTSANIIQEEIKKKITSIHQSSVSSNLTAASKLKGQITLTQEAFGKYNTSKRPQSKENNERKGLTDMKERIGVISKNCEEFK